MTSGTAGADPDPLRGFHVELDEHFRALGESVRSNALRPVFALEHGLSEQRRAELRHAVATRVRLGSIPKDAWLPVVAFAAEIGYGYVGDEYWDSFEAAAPGWHRHFDRGQLRTWFEKFASEYGGARPGGAWAEWFTIIAWPITHAVLPTDLQVHLARLLYDYRHHLTAGMLAAPDLLGESLAMRASDSSSSRFRKFTENTTLLGQVAAALLLGEGTESAFLLPATLDRVVEDLARERQALRWLTEAKARAKSVRLRGLSRSTGPRGSTMGRVESAGAPVDRLSDPRCYVRKGDDGWSAIIELPDLSVLATRFQMMRPELQRRRCVVAGAAGAPLARGRVLLPGQRLRLDRWPNYSEALLKIENAPAAANELLADYCRLSAGSLWLFRITEPGLGVEVRGRAVRAGHEYLVCSRHELETAADWVHRADMTTSGLRAYSLVIPDVIGPETSAALGELGLGVATDITFEPVGLVPALWDGEGAAEWVIGEEPLISITTTKALRACFLSIDGSSPEPIDLLAHSPQHQALVCLTDLGSGTHELHATLVPLDEDEPVIEGRLDVTIRNPRDRATSGSYRSAFFMLSSPAVPSLSEIWDDRASIEIFGPAGIPVRPKVTLRNSDSVLVSHHLPRTELPVLAGEWRRVFETFQRQHEVRQRFDDADSMTIDIAHDDLGCISLRAEREFTPLRWIIGRNRNVPYARLINNTAYEEVTLHIQDFATPGTTQQCTINGDRVEYPAGGLISATAGRSSAAGIIPPQVDTLDDLRRSTREHPRVHVNAREPSEVIRLCRLSQQWMTATVPGDIIARQRQVAVLREVADRLSALVGGQSWARAEIDATRTRPLSARRLAAAVGNQPDQRALAEVLERRAADLAALSVDKRVADFASLCSQTFRWLRVELDRDWVSEFLLRLASDPGGLLAWCGNDPTEAVGLVLQAPVLLRAARLVVLVTADLTAETDVATPYRGWTWE